MKIAVIVLLALIQLTPAPPAPPVPAASGALLVGTAGANALLAKHNTARTAKGVPVLTYSNDLANDAWRYGNLCKFPSHDSARHTSPSNSKPTVWSTIGENLYGAFPPATDITLVSNAAGDSWLGEEKDYLPGLATGSNCKVGAVCGHFTQMLWRATTHVGCAHKVCSPPTGPGLPSPYNTYSWSTITCRYGPSGNFVGQVAFETESFDFVGEAAHITKPGPHQSFTTVIGASVVVVALVALAVVVAVKVRRARSLAHSEEMSVPLA